MDDQFGGTYAGHYDLFYASKDYEAECDMIEAAFARHGRRVRSIVDFGCGTGSHVVPLARRGYELTGVDVAPAMLELAREKVAGADLAGSPALTLADVRTADLGRTFDAAIMMFAVLGYQAENADVRAALRTVRRHLTPGGLFVADFWYGPAVLTQRPGDRLRVIDTGRETVLRAASGTLDAFHHLSEVRYRIWRLEGDRVVASTEETHRMRFFFPQELAALCEDAGLDLVELTAFGGDGGAPDETTWNALMVARARGKTRDAD